MSYHTVDLSEKAFAGFKTLAEAAGLSVDDYLNRVGTCLPPMEPIRISSQLRADLEQAIEEVNNGEVISLDASRADLKAYKAQWRAGKKASAR